MKPNIYALYPDLYLIELIPPVPGFDQFIGSWLYKGKITCLIDVGPGVTVPFLLQALKSLQVNQLDYILLTHIHMDHAGGIGWISDTFPQAPVVCHGSGLPHLIDPDRLWAGSLKTLGDTAKAYGPMNPVPDHRLVAVEQLDVGGIKPVLTPGHSSHHASFILSDYLFVGEAGGVCLDLPDGSTWLRPATPPQHVLTTAISSIDALIQVAPERICYGHFGIRNGAAQHLARHRSQLLQWEQLIGEVIRNKESKDLDLTGACLQLLLREDSELTGLMKLPPLQQERELFFLKNSIKGFLGYLESLADKS